MKQKTGYMLAIVLLISGILACDITIGNISNNVGTVRGSGNVVEETREVNNISSVELALPGTLHLSMGSEESLRITAEDNLMEHIQTNVSLGRLVIESAPGTDLQATRPIDYYLTVTKLNSIAISSSGDIVAGDLVASAFSINISSSGDLSIPSLACDSLNVKSSSSGNVSIGQLNTGSVGVKISSSGNVELRNGQTQTQDINISSSGVYNAKDLTSTKAEVTISSSGNATVRVSDQLSGRISSSGNIYYIGSPAVNVSVSSTGQAIQISP